MTRWSPTRVSSRTVEDQLTEAGLPPVARIRLRSALVARGRRGARAGRDVGARQLRRARLRRRRRAARGGERTMSATTDAASGSTTRSPPATRARDEHGAPSAVGNADLAGPAARHPARRRSTRTPPSRVSASTRRRWRRSRTRSGSAAFCNRSSSAPPATDTSSSPASAAGAPPSWPARGRSPRSSTAHSTTPARSSSR